MPKAFSAANIFSVFSIFLDFKSDLINNYNTNITHIVAHCQEKMKLFCKNYQKYPIWGRWRNKGLSPSKEKSKNGSLKYYCH